jgi:hypothetical protein
MSTVKISELPIIPALNPDTTQTLFPAVDTATEITGRLTAKVLAATLYSNDVLNVGNTAVVFPGVIGQFVGNNSSYLQVNIQNLDGNGSTDMVMTADDGTDSIYYTDVGIQGSNDTQGTLHAHDGYLLVKGDDTTTTGNLIIGTTSIAPNVQIRFIAGGTEEGNVYAVFESSKAHFLNAVQVDGTLTGTTITTMNSYATTGYGQANAAFSSSNTVGTYANAAFGKANAGFIQANNAWTKANSAGDSAITAITNAAVADGKATSAFLKANNALANATGIFAGSLTITENLNVNGVIKFANSTISSTQPLVTISASNTGATQLPGGDGYVLHITGKHNVPTRVISDSYGANGQLVFPIFGGRAARGNVSNPSAVQTGDVLTRIGASGYGETAWQTGGTARIDFVASENYTNTSRGSQIKFYNVQEGSNTLVNIATFNANNVTFTGYVNPAKGVVYTPKLPQGAQTAITIDYTTDSVIKANCAADVAITHSNYVAGKIVEMWLVNTDNSNHTVTHGCAALRSTNKSTTATITAGSSMFLKFFSIDGDNANTFVSING